MGTGIQAPPNEYDFGLQFNYALWTPQTIINLVNVPFNNDYRDVVKFDTRADLNAYIDSIEGAGITITEMSYLKPNNPIRVNLPFNVVNRFNYVRASNPIQPIPGADSSKDFYYFITDVRYVAPNTTEIVVQLDIWSTFIFDITLGNSYVERGHIGIANENAFNGYERDYLTVPEGLDIGSEYQVLTKRNTKIMSVDGTEGVGTANNTVLVASTVDLLDSGGTETNPSLKSAGGSFFQAMPSGATYYVWKGASNFMAWLGSVRDTPWLTQGIVSITMIPDLARYGMSVV